MTDVKKTDDNDTTEKQPKFVEKPEESKGRPKKKQVKRGRRGRTELYFEIGRVCQVNFGPFAGKICIILDFVDSTRALVDGPYRRTGVPRMTIPFNRLSLTKIKCKIMRACRTGLVLKAYDEQRIQGKWERTNWAKRAKRAELRRNLSDFERFQVMCLQMKRSKLIRDQLEKIAKWRALAKEYKKGSVDEPEKLLAAKRLVRGIKNGRVLNARLRNKLTTDYNTDEPLKDHEFNQIYQLVRPGKGFRPWKKQRNSDRQQYRCFTQKKKQRALERKYKQKCKQHLHKMTREERKAKRLKLKKTIRQWGLTAGERKAKLRRLFPGKSHEEIVLLKRKFQQKLRWERKKAQKAAAKRKATRINQGNAARNKARKEARAKYLETFKEKMKDPKFKEAYFKRRDENIKKTAAQKAERKQQREEEEKLSTERKAKAKAAREAKAKAKAVREAKAAKKAKKEAFHAARKAAKKAKQESEQKAKEEAEKKKAEDEFAARRAKNLKAKAEREAKKREAKK